MNTSEKWDTAVTVRRGHSLLAQRLCTSDACFLMVVEIVETRILKILREFVDRLVFFYPHWDINYSNFLSVISIR